MTGVTQEIVKNKGGRPPKERSEIQIQLQEAKKKDKEEVKIGMFITVNTVNVKGLRINLDKVFSYAPNGDTSIQIAQGDGNNTTLNFGSKEEMLAVLEKLDSKCN